MFWSRWDFGATNSIRALTIGFAPLDVSSSLEMLTCAITELGFIRVLVQTPLYNVDLLSARTLLIKLKGSETLRFTFVSDDQDVSLLPSWVTTSKQITDGHLMQLAESKGAIFRHPRYANTRFVSDSLNRRPCCCDNDRWQSRPSRTKLAWMGLMPEFGDFALCTREVPRGLTHCKQSVVGLFYRSRFPRNVAVTSESNDGKAVDCWAKLIS